MTDDNTRYTLHGAQVFDGTGSDPRPGTVVIEDGRIAAVRGADARPRSDSTAFDLTGLMILPGLIDAHTHLGVIDLTGRADHTVAEIAAEIFANLRLCLDAGFTTVRDLGGLDNGVAELVARGRVPGPTIFPSGPLLCQTGGHGDFSNPYTGRDPLPCHPGLTQFNRPVDGTAKVLRGAESRSSAARLS